MIKAYAIAAVLTATTPVQTTDKDVATTPAAPAQAAASQIVVVNPHETSLRKWWGGRYGPR